MLTRGCHWPNAFVRLPKALNRTYFWLLVRLRDNIGHEKKNNEDRKVLTVRRVSQSN
jgi:hypothetical protein